MLEGISLLRLRRISIQGLKAIYEEYGKMIYSSALKICRDPHTAEDVTSEFFLKLRSAASVYKEGLGHKKWLLISVRNPCISPFFIFAVFSAKLLSVI